MTKTKKIENRILEEFRQFITDLLAQEREQTKKETKEKAYEKGYKEGVTEGYEEGIEHQKQNKKEVLEKFVGEIEKMKIGEAEGWELADKFNCCPGDDMADAYNEALKEAIQTIKNLGRGK